MAMLTGRRSIDWGDKKNVEQIKRTRNRKTIDSTVGSVRRLISRARGRNGPQLPGLRRGQVRAIYTQARRYNTSISMSRRVGELKGARKDEL